MSAGSLLAEIRSDPASRIVVGVTGVGGVGKRTLLDDIERSYRAAGIPVQRGVDKLRSSSRTAVLLVDDAHELSDDQVRGLRDIVMTGDSSLIVSYRSWPRSGAFMNFVRGLERERPAVHLGPLTAREVGERLRDAVGTAVSPEFADAVTELTGGMPWLVHRVVQGIRRDTRSVFERTFVPDAVIDQIALELANLDESLHDVLLALAVGFTPSDELSVVVNQDESRVQRDILSATSDGLLLANGAPIPLVKQALLRRASSHRVHAMQRELIDTMAAAGRSLDTVASMLVKDGLHDPRLAAALEAAADNALARNPAVAARLYEEALSNGETPDRTTARRAQAAWARGDLDEAGRLLDDLLSLENPPDVVRGAEVAAAVWAARGMMERSAEIFRWLGATRAGVHAPLGAIAMIATGDVAGATAMATQAPSASPTTLGVTIRLMGEGIRGSIGPEPDRALSTLVRASAMMTASQCSAPFPDSPAALAAIVAIHHGDLDVAAAVLDEAIADDAVSAPVNRLMLLRAWTAMQADRLDEARAYHGKVRLSPLSPRDEFLLRALEVGIARRSDDHFELSVAWQRARSIVLHVPTDLFTLLPLGEMMVAGARLADSHRLDEHVAEAWRLLDQLGNPPLWSICLHWSSVQAAILAERPSDLAAHSAALAGFAPNSRLAAVLATAAKAWAGILASDVRAAPVEHAARALAAAGFPWDGSRLAGHAAVRVEERKDMARLLACARDLRVAGSNASQSQTQGESDARPRPPQALPHSRGETARDDSGLSAREREVGRLVLAGKTYREIGETIFISARTAEHHIARIRRQLGATNRSDLLAQLRIALGTDNPDGSPE